MERREGGWGRWEVSRHYFLKSHPELGFPFAGGHTLPSPMKSVAPHWCKSNYQRLISEPIFLKDLIVSDRYIMLQNWFRGAVYMSPVDKGHIDMQSLLWSGVSHPLGRERSREILGYCTTENLGSIRQESILLFPSDRNKTISFQTLLQCRRKCALPGNFWQFFFPV